MELQTSEPPSPIPPENQSMIWIVKSPSRSVVNASLRPNTSPPYEHQITGTAVRKLRL